MSSPDEGAPSGAATSWPEAARAARLHFVSGKGGTGKTTVSAALALALAQAGRRVLLVEVEARQSIAGLFELPPLPPTEAPVAQGEHGGSVTALAIDIETTFLEYLDMFYNLGFAGRAMQRVGAVEFATTIAPGLKDVLLTGKIKETAHRSKDGEFVYDAVVVDAPPTGRIGSFLDVTKAMSDLARGGPVRAQSEGVVALLHSPDTVVHLVTVLEPLPVQETADAVVELGEAGLTLGTIIVNRAVPQLLSDTDVDAFARGDVPAGALREGLAAAGLQVADDELAGLVTEAIDHAGTVTTARTSAAALAALPGARLELPTELDGIDLGALYALAEVLAEQGVR